ncbi:N-acetylmuramoyl-L-alanine amidase [Candidatus Woesearchaeota archaeon]|nr:N-acetylmuramoyl-L-alanine amidase [Candidatus Woesearchaeota archaeon]
MRAKHLNNKKGVIQNSLIAIGFLIAVTIVATSYLIAKSSLDEKPIGMAQSAVLQIAHEGDKAVAYLDQAVSMAENTAVKDFTQQGGMVMDFEDGTYLCGSFMNRTYLYTQGQDCIPNPSKTFQYFFDAALFTSLSAHKTYPYPSFITTIVDDNDKTVITGQATEPFTFTFGGGGKAAFKLMGKEPFIPDYLGAQQPVTLNYFNRGGTPVSYIVVHYTVTDTAMRAIDVLRRRGLSYHYVIDHDGTVYQTVPESGSAQHAGCPTASYGRSYCKRTNMNRPSIGISFANMGYKTSGCDDEYQDWYQDSDVCWEPYTQRQLDSFVNLVADITQRHPALVEDGRFKESQMIMHSDVATVKVDPGPDFTRQQEDLIQRINDKMITTTRTPTKTTTTANEATIVAPTPEREARLEDYEPHIAEYGETYHVDDALIKAVILQSSGARPNHKGPEGNLGLMQLLPISTTGRSINHEFCVDRCGFSATYDEAEYYDPEKNICCGTALLAGLAKQQPLPRVCCEQDDVADCPENEDYQQPYHVAAQHYLLKTCDGCKHCVDEDYVADVMRLYEYYGGTHGQFTVDEDAAFEATYTIPLSFTTVADFDLSSYDEIAAFARSISDDCTDYPRRCVQEHVTSHNAHATHYRADTACEDNELLQSFVQHLDACSYTQDRQPCSFTLPTTSITEPFIIRINGSGVWEETLKKTLLGTRILATRPIIRREGLDYADFGSGPERTNITIYFREDRDGEQLLDFKFNGKFHDRSQDNDRPLNITTFTFFRDDEDNLIFSYEELPGSVQAPILSYLFCMEPLRQTSTANHNLSFALLLQDRVPPPVTGLQAAYTPALQVFELQWTPVTQYDDGKQVPDIAAYKVYCSEQPFTQHQPVPPSAYVASVKRSNKGFFPPAAYQQQGVMSFPLERCGGKPISNYIDDQTQTMSLLYVAVTAVDGAGQYNKTYPSVTLSADLTQALQFPPNMPEQANEVIEPSLGRFTSFHQEIPDEYQLVIDILGRYYSGYFPMPLLEESPDPPA